MQTIYLINLLISSILELFLFLGLSVISFYWALLCFAIRLNKNNSKSALQNSLQSLQNLKSGLFTSEIFQQGAKSSLENFKAFQNHLKSSLQKSRSP